MGVSSSKKACSISITAISASIALLFGQCDAPCLSSWHDVPHCSYRSYLRSVTPEQPLFNESRTGVEWPPAFQVMSRIYSILVTPFQILPVSCGVPYTFYHEVYAYTLIPIALVGAVVVVTKHLEKKAQIGTIKHVELEAYMKIKRMELALLICFFALPTASLYIFQTYMCIEFADGSSYLDADLSLQCTDTDGQMVPLHAWMVTFASLMMLVFPLGIPSMYFVLIKKHEDGIRALDDLSGMPCPDELKHIEQLFKDYDTKSPYGEVKLCIYRIVMCSLVALFSTKEVVRALVGILFAVLFAISYRESMPFSKHYNNGIAQAATWQITFTFVMAFLLISEPVKLNKNGIGWGLVLVNLFVLGVAAAQTKLEARNKVAFIDLQNQVITISKELNHFKEIVVGVVAAQCTMGLEAREKFRHEWKMEAEEMDAKELQDAVAITIQDLNIAEEDVRGTEEEKAVVNYKNFVNKSEFFAKRTICISA